MRVGMVIQTDLPAGGAHTFEWSFQRALASVCDRIGYELVTFTAVSRKKVSDAAMVTYKLSPLRMALSHLRANPILYKLLCLIGLGKSHLERVAKREQVDLLIFASPNHLAAGIHSVPFATTVWDFGHVDMPQAVETALGGLWAWREDLYQKTLRRSIVIYCDSDATANRLVGEYGVVRQRIVKIGLLPNVESIQPLLMDKPHFIYPAMFWPHKNHAILLRAFRKFLDSTGSSAYLVLTGAGREETRIRELVKELELIDFVRFEGLVSRTKLLSLIKGSIGLLMPSMLGPSNLPPLEATLMNVPAVLSDSHSMEDLLVAATYVGVFNSDSWANAMNSLLQGKVLPASVQEIDVPCLIEESLRRVKDQLLPWTPK